MYKFKSGQIVWHRRYAYRGVIMSADAECAAADEWYERNQTQPAREQPWYHVLVDAGTHGASETYVAEENLELDAAGGEVRHPMVPLVFPTYRNGQYYRQSLN